MADTNAFVDMGRRALDQLLSISATVILIIAGGLIVVGILYYFFIYRRKFDILVKITSLRAKDPNVYFDRAAILKDKKTGNKYLKLLKTRAPDIRVPPFKIMTSTNWGDYIEILRKSEDSFVFLTSAKIDKEMVIRHDGKAYPVGRTIQKHTEDDLYYIAKRREENKKLLDSESLLSKLLLWAPQILSLVFILIILWMFMTKVPQILDSLIDLTQEMQKLNQGRLTAAWFLNLIS